MNFAKTDHHDKKKKKDSLTKTICLVSNKLMLNEIAASTYEHISR